MEIKILKKTATEIGLQKFVKFGINKDSWGWRDKGAYLNLQTLGDEKTEELRKLLLEHIAVAGVSVLLRDIQTWREALMLGAGKQKARNTRQFESLLSAYLASFPRHHLYSRVDDMADVYVPYYVTMVEYVPAHTQNGYTVPAYTFFKIAWEEFGGIKEKRVDFDEEDCRGMSVVEALARKNFFAESKELRAKYQDQTKRFTAIHSQIGKQYWASGTAKDNLDGNPKGRGDSWYWSQTHTIQMVRENNPTRVAVDVFYESDNSYERDRDERKVDLRSYFWHNRKFARSEEEDDDYGEADDGTDERPEIEVPIHPLVAVFDFSKHLRLRIHVDYLTEYVYEKNLEEKLILPDEQKQLVKLLIEYKTSAFRDLVRGKSGGAVVLLAGPPGVGKTLTAEIYAESEERALYSVQCSQLGTDPNELEDELLKVFARARRWNAVMLLDEADVYVRERGGDLQQNAIVGVFLRVLEYQSSVLFLTTNRPDDVDDAIASRCIARIEYAVPTPDLQEKIWKVLADASGISVPAKLITEIVKQNPELSGRDVKNLLKLGSLSAKGKSITPDVIAFVKKFKPTGKHESAK